MEPRRRKLIPFTAALFWSVYWLALGPSPASGYQREVQAAANAISEKLAAAGKKSVAVVDFTDLQGEVTELGRFLAEEISVALTSGDRPLEVVDRTHLKVLVQENKLSATGLIDPATAKKLGQIAGVHAIVTGTLTPFGDTVRLTLKVLDTATARIVAATTSEIPKTKAIEELVARGVGGVGAPQPDNRDPISVGIPKPVEFEGVRFTLKRCTPLGGSVRCELLVENLTEAAVGVSVWGAGYVSTSYLYDSLGNQFGGAGVAFGMEGSGGARIFPGIPIAVRITFGNLPDDLKIVSLSLSVSVGPQSQVILFRKVPLTR